MPVAFFIEGVEFKLPHPQIPQRTILLMCKVIRKAWQLLEEKPPSGFHLESADEKKITQQLVEIINVLRHTGEVNGFNKHQFGRVIRDPKVTNFDKTHLDKMPDVLFLLNRERLPIIDEHDGLFVECKPVDARHPISSHYCHEGLVRFVNGNYAWAMQDALMVGYIKGRYSFEKLASVLDDHKNNATLKPIAHSAVEEYEIYRSSHKRDFNWLDNRGQACPITVLHLWVPK